MAVFSRAMLVGHASPTPLSSSRIIDMDLNSARSRLHTGSRLHSPRMTQSTRSPQANRIRCTLHQNDHDSALSIIHADPASPDWQSSTLAVVQPNGMTQSILSINDVTIPKIDIGKEPLMFLPIDLPLRKTKLGLTEAMVRRISKYNNEPQWMLQFRLDAFHQFLLIDEPQGAHCPPFDFQAIYTQMVSSKHISPLEKLHELELGEATLYESNGDSFATTHKEALTDAGVIFCSISEAIRDHPELVRNHLGKVVAPSDNFYAALNSAVFLDGSFCYVPENVICPMDISTHFLVDGRKITSPFERTLIVCEANAFVSSLGCTSPPPPQAAGGATSESIQQLHAPVIELFCAAGAEIKHVTVQNWVEAGATPSTREAEQEERSCNYSTQRGLCDGARSKITWTIVEAGSGVVWQHPAVVLKGDESVGECYTVTLTNGRQQADTGATMIHSGRQTRSRIVGKTISAGSSQSCFRSVVNVEPWSRNARSEVQRDSILVGDHAESTSSPSVVARNTSAQIQEKGSTSRINSEQIFMFQQRGIVAEKAVPAILTGFCDAVLRELPHEFESEVTEMVAMKIEEFLKGSL
ncbi:hypothetical protein M758_5G079000 [Ceratodon purpureus]|nr:hypothetical protein M758_5G079000 [Ceratodon purpureus]